MITVRCSFTGCKLHYWSLIENVDHSAVVRPRVARFMGEGLGWVEGEQEHKEMRRLSMPALTCIPCLFCLYKIG